jgi:hypothetical protein
VLDLFFLGNCVEKNGIPDNIIVDKGVEVGFRRF